jgi:outer membrane receptor protein involved in Fe transport
MKKVFILIGSLLLPIALVAQEHQASVSGMVIMQQDRQPLPYVNVIILQAADSSFVTGTVSGENGRFSIDGIVTGDYLLKTSFMGFEEKFTPFRVGRINAFLDLGNIAMTESTMMLQGVTVAGARQEVLSAMDKKVYTIDENISQLGGSVAQAMQNLPGVTVDREGNVSLRGSNRVSILLDGKQTAITGMGAQAGLENIPASSIERIEIINNPSARYDASGMAGIINIIFRKEQQQGWNGRAGLTLGAGSIAMRRENLPGIRDQYSFTPKINPSLSLNYRQNAVNFFVHGDLLYHQSIMKNEFFLREHEESIPISQQWLENRTQPIYNIRLGADYTLNPRNTLTFSALGNYRAYTDLGDLPYINTTTGDRVRLWQYYEEEINQTLFLTLTHKHLFPQAGHELTSSFNYSFRRKDEVFYFDNFQYLENFTGTDTTMLVADENIFDLTLDYLRPLRSGRIEIGTKQRARIFPNFITFIPGVNSILDMGLAGSAEYRDYLSALYSNYVYELRSLELEAGLRLEYARVDYLVDPNHSVYESDGFDYLGLFPNVRASWLMSENHRLTAFYNRRVDRPEERNLRVFPTYADPEILNMGNPGLDPQFTQSLELGFRQSWQQGFLYAAAYHRIINNILTKILTPVPGTNRLASVDQNAGDGFNSGLELVFSQQAGIVRINTNANVYQNIIEAFTIVNAYPSNIPFSAEQQDAWAGNVKLNLDFDLPSQIKLQLTGTWFSANILPQGRILPRWTVDGGVTKKVLGGRGELFANMSDIFNTLVMEYELEGSNFTIRSSDYYETQVVRVGFSYRF